LFLGRAFLFYACCKSIHDVVFITQQPVQGVASSCKIPSALSTADTASSNSCIPFTAMLILAKAEAAFAVYSSCEIPLGLAYGINSTVLQCQSGF
jgi:hypothetical protein